MNQIPVFAMKNKTIVMTIVGLLLVFGTYSFFQMPRREDPKFTIMSCLVTTQWPGASAEDVESLVTDPLEEILDGIEEVDIIRSTSTIGLSSITVDLRSNTPPWRVDQVWSKVRTRVESVTMPADNVKPFVTDDFGDTTIILFALYQKPIDGKETVDRHLKYTPRQLDIYSDRVRNALRVLPGVAKTSRYGVREEVIYIEAEQGLWSQQQITTASLKAVVESKNIRKTGGTIDSADVRYLVNPQNLVDGLQEVTSSATIIEDEKGNNNQVNLESLGLDVKRGYRDPARLLCRFGDAKRSVPAVMIGLTMKADSSIVDICEIAKKRIVDLKERDKLLPPDIEVTAVSDQSGSVNARIYEVLINVLEAVVTVVILVYFVVGFRTAAVMAASIPFVMIISFAIIPLFGVQLEQMSLASMIISLGLLVDNAVQVCDQSRVNQIQGMDPATASIKGAQTLAAPMLNGTLTTMAAFLPMVFAFDGGNREFIYSLPITLSTMLGVSWLVAMTLCVILAAGFIRPPKDPSHSASPVIQLVQWIGSFFRRKKNRNESTSEPGPISNAENSVKDRKNFYDYVGNFAGTHKFATLGLTMAIFVACLGLQVRSEFFPKGERDQFAIEVWLPETVSLDKADQAARKVEDLIRKLSPSTNQFGNKIERLHSMRTLVGGGGSRWYLSWTPQPQRANFAEILVRTTDRKLTTEFANRIREVAEKGSKELGIQPVVGMRVVPIELLLGPPAAPVTLRVTGEGYADIDKLREISAEVKTMVETQPETWDANDSWGVDGHRMRINIDDEKANLAGVTKANIANSLTELYTGFKLTTLYEGDHAVPVLFRLKPDVNRTIVDIESTYVDGNAGKVPLKSIASVRPTLAPSVIERRDLNRTIEVRSRVLPGTSGNDVVNRVMASKEMEDLKSRMPDGFRVEIGGALEESQKAGGKMLLSFAISFFSIILLIVIQFNSLSKTIVIMSTLPLAVVGALFGLYITDNAMGFMPQLGLLSLFGIVLNTAIIFIEFADILLEEKQKSKPDSDKTLTHHEIQDCLVRAGKQRLLPIFLTTATTVGGLIPLALVGGPLWVSMAWLMIFGLSVATMLTLVVVPALFMVFSKTLRISPISR